MKTIITLMAIAMLPFMVSAQNLLINGGFENGLTGWNNMVGGDSAAATFTLETTGSIEGVNHMKVDVDTAGATGWTIQSFSPTFNAIKDSTYQVTWTAKSSVDGVEMNVIFNDPAGQQYGAKKTLSTEWQSFNKTWVAAETGETYIKMWWMEVAEYHIDSVVVIDPLFDDGKETQTITIDAIDNKFTTDEPFDVTATASSGLDVSLSIKSGPATISGNTITLDGTVGTVVVLAEQAGDDTYNSASKEVSFDVNEPGVITEQTLETDAKIVVGTITIDGAANEANWAEANEIVLGTYYNDANNSPNYFTDNPTSADLSATAKTLWDENGIYVLVDVTDDVIHVDNTDIIDNGKSHTYDNVEIYFHVPVASWDENLKETGDYTAGTFQLRTNPMLDDFWSGRSVAATGTSGGWVNAEQLNDYWTYKYSSKSGGVIYEAFFPFDKLFVGSSAALPKVADGRSILFEIAYGDSDGSGVGGLREGGIVWNQIPANESDVAYNDKAQFGQLNLTSETTGVTNARNSKSITVQPNPFKNDISIISLENLKFATIYSITGQEVLRKTNLMETKTIQGLDALDKGIYFLRVTTITDKVITVKLIKE